MLYHGHVPTTAFEKGIMTIGSAFLSLTNPRRGDMVAVLGETTSSVFIKKLYQQMITSSEGLEILKAKPRITSTSLDLDFLKTYKKNTLGSKYLEWLEYNHVSPDTRKEVRYIDHPDLAYCMQRYRESHDFYHTLAGLPVNVHGELALKWYEWVNMGLPIAAISAIFGPLRLTSKERERLRRVYIPWALKSGSQSKSLINIYWEKRLDQDIDELRSEFNMIQAPPLPPRRRLRKL